VSCYAHGTTGSDGGSTRRLSRPVDDGQFDVIDYVVGGYGRYTGRRELVRETHLEDPWRDVSESEDSFAAANPEITHESLRAWFSQDDEYLAHRSAVTALRERRDVYGFEGPAMPDDLREATLRIVSERTPS